MYKVFLVEDEIVVREGIRNSLNWDSTGFQLSGEAADGEMAIPLIQEIKPDILVTDIEMPFMNGLQLSWYVKKNMPWVKIIILSGHDEFNYAREALSIGVTDYLLKPISSSELITVFNKLAMEIEEERKEVKDLEKLKVQLDENRVLFKEKFLNELSLGLVSSVDAVEKAAHFDLNIISRFYLVEIIEIELGSETGSNDEYSEYVKVDAIIANILINNNDVIKFKRSIEEIVLLFKGDSAEGLEESAYSLAQSIKYEIERSTCSLVSIGIGSVAERINGIAKSFKDAEMAKNYRYIFGKNKIIGIRDVKEDGFDKIKLLQLKKNSMFDYLKSGTKTGFDAFFDDYFSRVDKNGIKSTMYLYYIYMDVILDIARFVEELGGSLESIAPEIADVEGLIYKLESKEQFGIIIKEAVSKVLDYRDKKIINKYESIISKARTYIDSNYSDPNLSLNTISKIVNVSPSHFSTIFSQETGETFIEYLTKVRMKKAMELLRSTTMKSSEIAYNIGYSDPHYFSYLFKKTTGFTPKEFRNE